MTSTDNIRRRYRHLFSLPSARVASIQAYVTALLISTFPTVFLRAPPLQLLFSAASPLATLTASVLLERKLLGGSLLATYKRLLSLSFISNLWWLFTSMLGLLFLQGNKYHAFFILGLFATVSFRYIVIRAVFAEKWSKAVTMSLEQPLILSLINYPLWFQNLTGSLIPTIGGILLLASSILYLHIIQHPGLTKFKDEPLAILKYFLEAWTSGKADSLEKFMEKESSEAVVETNFFKFTDQSSSTVIVTTDIHPGPFHPVGSSNLPYEMHHYLQRKGYSPMILHGITDHRLNLPSRKEVEHYLSTLDEEVTEASSKTSSKPVLKTLGKATVTGVSFTDNALLTVSSAPHGMEDLPLHVRERIQSIGKTLGFRKIMVIDAHNSEGGRASSEESEDIVNASSKVLEELKQAPQQDFKVGFSHTDNSDFKFEADVGPGGIGVWVLETGGEKLMLIGADANNAKVGLRDSATARFNSTARYVELCTSDSHITAGRASQDKGYYALGELTPIEKLIEALEWLKDKAVENLRPASFEASFVKSRVKLMGERILDEFSAFLDRTSRVGKNAGAALFLIYILLFVLAALF